MRLAGRLLAALAVGLLLGLVGAAAQSWAPDLLGVRLPVGAAIGVVTAALVARACAWWVGSRAGAVAHSVGWLGATLAMGTTTPSGDLVLSSGTRQVGYLVVGSMVLAACCGFPLLPDDDTPEPALAAGAELADA
ncbi:MAG: hypothetical protein MUF35_10055 [Candidatus Nanopelagicales bacterium]|jgi:hypothetical protein|nr:hypothetical protein [Candidatus Nanopelagicales bacterium]